jgi:hypothetical protein
MHGNHDEIQTVETRSRTLEGMPQQSLAVYWRHAELSTPYDDRIDWKRAYC